MTGVWGIAHSCPLPNHISYISLHGAICRVWCGECSRCRYQLLVVLQVVPVAPNASHGSKSLQVPEVSQGSRAGQR